MLLDVKWIAVSPQDALVIQLTLFRVRGETAKIEDLIIFMNTGMWFVKISGDI